MKGGLRFYLAGAVAAAGARRLRAQLLAIGERAAWRHEAEVACLKSGAVKIGAGVVQIEPIEGPGMCGADFPLKVAALGESSALGYADELRPPAAIPNAPRRNAALAGRRAALYAAGAGAIRAGSGAPTQGQPVRGENMRWVPGPPGIERPQVSAPAGRPMSLDPSEREPDVAPEAPALPEATRRGGAARRYSRRRHAAARARPRANDAPRKPPIRARSRL